MESKWKIQELTSLPDITSYEGIKAGINQNKILIQSILYIVMMMQLLIVLFKEETIGDDEIDFLEEMNINND